MPKPGKHDLYPTGVEIPLYAGAAGKAILAFAPSEIVEQQVLVPINPKTITNPDELRQQLEQIRENGWATGEGERIPDAYGVAAPIFTAGTVTRPVVRLRTTNGLAICEPNVT